MFLSILDEDISQAKSAKYLIERASHELYMPCKCEITDDVASFVAMIMQGTKEKKIELAYPTVRYFTQENHQSS